MHENECNYCRNIFSCEFEINKHIEKTQSKDKNEKVNDDWMDY